MLTERDDDQETGAAAQTRVLDGPTALAVLTAAVDPYAGGDASWPRATPHTPITAHLFTEPYPEQP